MIFDMVWRNARLATLREDLPSLGGPSLGGPSLGLPGLGVVERGAVACSGGRIAYAGPEDGLPGEAARSVDCDGRWITPGLIDCHTHLVFGGDRAREFERRLEGASYEQIAREGGGIVSTVRATRAASPESLAASALRRLDHLLAEGVTTIEVKSGYGLDLASERMCLSVARGLAAARPVSVATTCLAAHAVPPEFAGRADAYVEEVCARLLPALAREGLVDAVDAFCEGIAFSPAQVRRVFAVARGLGLPVKLHADQLSNLHGAALAAEHGALSADHLEHTDEAGCAALARAGTVAVLLPGAFHTLRETQPPPVEALRRHGVRIALATDSNPGTSPLTSLLLAMNFGATLFRLTAEECLAGVTREAARALGLLADRGTLEAGKWCDLAIWDVDRLAELPYRMGFNPLHRRVYRGA